MCVFYFAAHLHGSHIWIRINDVSSKKAPTSRQTSFLNSAYTEDLVPIPKNHLTLFVSSITVFTRAHFSYIHTISYSIVNSNRSFRSARNLLYGSCELKRKSLNARNLYPEHGKVIWLHDHHMTWACQPKDRLMIYPSSGVMCELDLTWEHDRSVLWRGHVHHSYVFYAGFTSVEGNDDESSGRMEGGSNAPASSAREFVNRFLSS